MESRRIGVYRDPSSNMAILGPFPGTCPARRRRSPLLLLAHGAHLALDAIVLVVSSILLALGGSLLEEMVWSTRPVDDLHLAVLATALAGACCTCVCSLRSGFEDAREMLRGLERRRSV